MKRQTFPIDAAHFHLLLCVHSLCSVRMVENLHSMHNKNNMSMNIEHPANERTLQEFPSSLNVQARQSERRFHCIPFNVDRIITVELYGKLIINSSVCTGTQRMKYKHSFAKQMVESRREKGALNGVRNGESKCKWAERRKQKKNRKI